MWKFTRTSTRIAHSSRRINSAQSSPSRRNGGFEPAIGASAVRTRCCCGNWKFPVKIGEVQKQKRDSRFAVVESVVLRLSRWWTRACGARHMVQYGASEFSSFCPSETSVTSQTLVWQLPCEIIRKFQNKVKACFLCQNGENSILLCFGKIMPIITICIR